MEEIYKPSTDGEQRYLLDMSNVIENAPYMLNKGYDTRIAGGSTGSSSSSSHSGNSSSSSASGSKTIEDRFWTQDR